MSTLDRLLLALDMSLAPEARAAIDAHARLLLAWNRLINLTAVRDAAAVALEHVADSLTAVPLLRGRRAAHASLVDIGSGGGYPGLPLAVALPAERALLVDSIGKKARFLAVAAAAARAAFGATGGAAPDVRAEAVRAEALARRDGDRGSFDLVTARAVGSLAQVAELGLPLAAIGGRVVAWKRDDGSGRLDDEIGEAQATIRQAGGVLETVEQVDVPGLEDHRLILLAKRRETPARFPRPPEARRRRARPV